MNTATVTIGVEFDTTALHQIANLIDEIQAKNRADDDDVNVVDEPLAEWEKELLAQPRRAPFVVTDMDQFRVGQLVALRRPGVEIIGLLTVGGIDGVYLSGVAGRQEWTGPDTFEVERGHWVVLRNAPEDYA